MASNVSNYSRPGIHITSRRGFVFPANHLVAVLVISTAFLASPCIAAETSPTPTLQEVWAELQKLKQENQQLQREVQELRSATPQPAQNTAAINTVSAPAIATTPVVSGNTPAKPSENSGTNKPTQDKTDLLVYGVLRGQISQLDNNSEVEDGGSRVGFKFRQNFSDDMVMIAAGEFGINFFDSTLNLSLDPNGPEDFANVKTEKSPGSFAPRLGYIGIDFAQWGKLSIGKQNSVFKDIADWPDIMNVLSGKGAFTFSPTGTDGGEFGTGRADNAAIYRNTFGGLQLGLQTQLNAIEGERTLDSLGASLQYTFADGLTLGAAFQHVYLDPSVVPIDLLRGLEGDPEFAVLGLNYRNGPFYLAAIYNYQRNGNFTTVSNAGSDISVFYGASGVDVMGSYGFNDRWKGYAGYAAVDPITDDPLIAPDFHFSYYTFGLEYALSSGISPFYQAPRMSVYIEAQIDNSIDANGMPGPNVFLVGLRYLFDHQWTGQ